MTTGPERPVIEDEGFAVVAAGEGITVVSVSQEVDLASEGAFRDAVQRALEQDGVGVVIDLTGCSFLDSSGMRVLVHAHRAAVEQRLLYAITCTPAGPVNQLLRIALADVLPLHPDLPTALAAVAAERRGAAD